MLQTLLVHLGSSLGRKVLWVAILLAIGMACQSASAETAPAPAEDCIPIWNLAQLASVNSNPNGNYCLMADIDASEKVPFGSISSRSFGGEFNGNGHVIWNVNIRNYGNAPLPLFLEVGPTGSVHDLTIGRIKFRADPDCCNYDLGLFASKNYGRIQRVNLLLARIEDVYSIRFGVLVGRNEAGGIIDLVSATGTFLNGRSFKGDSGGGITAQNRGSISRSFVTLRFEAGSACDACGGLVGMNFGTIAKSFSSGLLRETRTSIGANVGGLTGWNVGAVEDSYSTMNVDTVADGNQTVGGLIGNFDFGDQPHVSSVFSAGKIHCPNCGGGLIGKNTSGSQVAIGFWDRWTSGKSTSAGGNEIGANTSEAKSLLYSALGFDPQAWSNSVGRSYPFLISPTMYLPSVASPKRTLPARTARFRSTLAELATNKGLFPIDQVGQLEPWQYAHYRRSIAATSCKASVYAMIARAVGMFAPDALVAHHGISEPLSLASVDYFLNADGDAVWPTTNKTLQKFVAFYRGNQKISSPTDGLALPFRLSDVITQLSRGNLVMIRGSTGGSYHHWMLATAVQRLPGGNIVGIWALDPELGQQVQIDAITLDKTYLKVTNPANYSTLTGFVYKAESYFTVVINEF